MRTAAASAAREGIGRETRPLPLHGPRPRRPRLFMVDFRFSTVLSSLLFSATALVLFHTNDSIQAVEFEQSTGAWFAVRNVLSTTLGKHDRYVHSSDPTNTSPWWWWVRIKA